MRSRLVSCLSGNAVKRVVDKCPIRRKQPAAVKPSKQWDQPVIIGNLLYSEAEKPDAAEEAECQRATMPLADSPTVQEYQVQLHFTQVTAFGL